MIRLSQIKISLDEKDYNNALKKQIKKLLKIDTFNSLTIVKMSIDARKKPDLYRVFTVDVDVDNENVILKKSHCKQAVILNSIKYKWPEGKIGKYRPVIVGMGPAGLFCAYKLALSGCKPIICERGKSVDERTKDVSKFWESGILNPESNVQFGEGGAGTFSDGKLNTVVNDKSGRNMEVFRIFVENGAPDNILYDSKPHIGTDILAKVVSNMRKSIIANGGEVRFSCKLTDINHLDDNLVEAYFSDGSKFITDALVLAIGHSARDTFYMLKDKLPMIPKAFAVGLRVQHKQDMIDTRQYGRSSDNDILPVASYKLTHQCENGLGVYSFCMCPGGYVVNASSEEEMLAVNGMSYHNRASGVANSAIVVTVNPEDYISYISELGGDDTDTSDCMCGVTFQRLLESASFRVGNGSIPYEGYLEYKAGVTKTDYKLSEPDFEPRFKGSAIKANVHEILPDRVNKSLVEGIDSFNRIIPGFAEENAYVAGVESRTSSPVRILRGDNYQSEYSGIYPCGEGAGYAGGITSAAMDGIIIAEEIWKR